MIARDIWRRAHALAPQLRETDMWALLTKFTDKGLLFCPNANQQTGKVFALTPIGQKVFGIAFRRKYPPYDSNTHWNLYSFVVRAQLRQSIVLEIEKARFEGHPGLSPGQLRKRLKDRHPHCLNSTTRTLQALTKAGVVQCKKGKTTKTFSLSDDGRKIVPLLQFDAKNV